MVHLPYGFYLKNVMRGNCNGIQSFEHKNLVKKTGTLMDKTIKTEIYYGVGSKGRDVS